MARMSFYVLTGSSLIIGRGSYLVTGAIEPGAKTESTTTDWYTTEVRHLPVLVFFNTFLTRTTFLPLALSCRS